MCFKCVRINCTCYNFRIKLKIKGIAFNSKVMVRVINVVPELDGP